MASTNWHCLEKGDFVSGKAAPGVLGIIPLGRRMERAGVEGLGMWPLLCPLHGDANSMLSLISRSLMAPPPPWLLGGSLECLCPDPCAGIKPCCHISWPCSSIINQEVYVKHDWNPNSHLALIPISLLVSSHFCMGVPCSALGSLGLLAWADLQEGVPGNPPGLGGYSQKSSIRAAIPIPTFEAEFSWNYPRLG